MNPPAAKPVQRFGPETWAEVAGRDWSLWDLWFCAIAVADHRGELDALARAFADDLRSVGGLHRRDANEAKLSHARDLAERLTATGLAPVDVATPAVVADQKVMRRAREKVLRSSHLEGRACTPAFHTAGLEFADAADDSYGNVGQARTDAWLTYLAIDWRATAIEPEVYWRDLCELRLWEPYAVDHQHENAWFRSARTADIDLIEAILLDLEEEHRNAVLDHQADDAVDALADLYLATTARARYVSAARRIGSRSWRPIVAMAESHLKARDSSGALEVFRAADQAGFHRDHLRRRCLAMTGVDLATETEGTTR